MQTPSNERQAFRVPEFARRHGIGRTKAFEEIAAGRLKAKKIGSATVIPRDAEKAWLESLPDAKARAT